MAIYKLQALPTDSGAIQAGSPDSPALQEQERTIIELIAACLEQKQYRSVANALVNELASQLDCDRVSLALRKGKNLLPQVISHSADFNKGSKLIRLIGAAMDEALDQKQTIVFPADENDSLTITVAHQQLSKSQGQKSICTVLLTHQHEIVGAISLERAMDQPFSKETIFFCHRLAILIAPLLLLKYEEEYWLRERAWNSVKKRWLQLTSRGHYSYKTLVGSALLLILLLAFATGTYRVSGDAVLEGKIQRMITSPVDGFIAEVHTRAGDIVKSGQLLASLDDRELKLEKMKIEGEYDRYKREYRDARAKYDLTQVSITSARMQQAKAQLDITTEQLKRLHMVAPFDGVVVEGNLEQALGSPVERGQVLLKLAPLNDYRIILKVDDRDIAVVNTRQAGYLALAGLPGEALKIRVKNITPVSIAEDGRNYFKVEAQLEQKNTLLRPGMRGIGKIEIGQRKLIWIWSHRFTDWLRYWIWSL